MVVSFKVDDYLISDIEKFSKSRSDFIREAILYYLNYKKSQEKLLKAIEKTKEFDLQENLELDGTLSDGI